MDSLPHLLLDAAKMDGYIFLAREMNEQHRCLYEGDSEKFLGAVAPWLFEVDANSEFTDWVVEMGAGQSWGVVLYSAAEKEELYRHLRKFLIVDTEQGKELYFRYYDPRVLRVFLPTCDTEQLIEFFGPIDAFILEDEEGKLIRFSLDGHSLQISPLEIDLKTVLDYSIVRTGETEVEVNSNSIQETLSPAQKEGREGGTSDRWDFGF